MAKTKVVIPRRLQDADQILIWKAAIALMDGRSSWPRAMKRAIEMIEAREPGIKQKYQQVRACYVRAYRKS